MPALGHDMPEDFTYVAPTCTEKGGEVCKCRRTGCTLIIIKSSVPALGHVWDVYGICLNCNTSNGDITLADNADNRNKIIRLSLLSSIDVTLQGRTLYKDGAWNTLCLPFDVDNLKGTPLEWANIKELESSTSNLTGSVLTLNFKDAESIVAGKPYIVRWDMTPDLVISSDEEWATFAANVTNSAESYEGKRVQLGDDITVTEMVGGTFKGILDGAGHTITTSLSGSGEGTALFYEINGATIQNLKVTGSITTSGYRPATFASFVSGYSTIKNCWSAADISSTKTDTWVDGGAFIGRVSTGAMLNMQNCAFTGTVTYDDTANEGGGMVGWTQSGATAILTRCLFAPTALNMSKAQDKTYIFVSGNVRGTLTDCYYNDVAATTTLKAEGTPATENLLSDLGDRWQTDGGYVVPKMNIETTIDNPVFSGVTISYDAPTPVVSNDGMVTFTGSYSPVSFTANDQSILFLGAKNTLYYPSADMTIGSCRAYFKLNNPTAVKSFKLNFDDSEDATSIDNSQLTIDNEDSSLFTLHSSLSGWYTLDGRRLAEPQKGINIIRNSDGTTRKVLLK